MKRSAEEQQLLRAAWGAGDLRYMLYELQCAWNRKFEESRRRIFVIECSRRIGKTVFLLTKAFELCIKKKGAQVRYAAPTAKAVRLEASVEAAVKAAMREHRDDLQALHQDIADARSRAAMEL